MDADDGAGGAKLSTPQWAQVWEIFQAAAALPPPERDSFVRSSGAPVGVSDRVLVLLAENEQEQTEAPPTPGRQYGRYTLVKLLGAGGMGEVYAAHDSELDRQVALKFLGAKAKLLPSSVERLVREAQAASALNHPNLITVFDVLHSEAGTALVTELVDGQPMRALCGRVHPVREVAAWGAQVARGLAAAHGQGIVHGDIKPENVMVRADGYIKVLDFGLAQREGRLGGVDGIPLGTLGYMSPEQTGGETLSGASDVFSLGVMLLELSSGQHPFLECTAASTTQAILHRQPEMPEPTGAGDREFVRLLGAMLRKSPGERPGASEVAARLEAIAERTQRPRFPRRRIAAAAAGLLVLGGAAGAGIWLRGREDPIVASAPYALTTYSGLESQPAFSPDGTRIVFVWSGPQDDNPDIYVRSLAQGGDPRRLTTDPRAEFSPAWSPDGASIAYMRRATDGGASQVIVVPAAGGAERVVGSVVDPMGYRGMAWWPDSQSLIVRDAVGQGRPLVRLFIGDGRKQTLTASFGTQDFRPSVSPDGRSMAFLRQQRDRWMVCRIGLPNGPENCMEWKAKANSIAWYGDSLHLLVSDPRGLWAERLEAAGHGVPTRLQEGAFVDLATDRPARHLAFARNYLDLNIWRLDFATGRSARVAMSSEEDSDADYSPDGRLIVFRSNRTGTYELYISQPDGANVRQLTSLGIDLGSPRWSPDGKWIAFDAADFPQAGSGAIVTVSSLYLIPAEGGAGRQLTGDRTETMVPNWSRDGKWIYYMEDPGGHRETWKLAVDGGAKVQVSKEEMFDVAESADSRWLYYARPATERGVWRRAAEGGPEELVKGTEDLVFRSFDLRGNQLYFLRAGPQPGFVVKNLDTGAIRLLGPPPTRVFNGPRVLAASPDGRSLLYVQEDLSLGDLMMLDLVRK
ncbi:MAG TPA: protein kinase [Bryobacteraceae bacterium]